jgi:hypothetical protein
MKPDGSTLDSTDPNPGIAGAGVATATINNAKGVVWLEIIWKRITT